MLNPEYKSELKNIAVNAGIGAFGIMFLNLMAFVNNAIITRTLGADDYGLFVLATNILYFIVIISQFGFGSTIVRYVSYYTGKGASGKVKGTIRYSAKVLLVSGLVLTVLAFLLSPVISTTIFDRPELTAYLKILLLSLPFLVVTVVVNASLNGLKLIKYQVLSTNILHPLLFFTFISIVFLAGYRLTGLIWVVFIMGIAGLLIPYFFLYTNYFKISKKIKPEVDKKELWKFAFPMYLIHFLNNAVLYIPIFLIGYFLSNTEVGVYNISFKLALLVSFSLGAFQLIFSPTISNLFARNNKQLIEQLYQSITKWIFTISLVTFFIIMLFSGQFLSIFGKEFITGSTILLIMVCGEIFNATGGLAGNILIMSGRPKVALVNSLVAFVSISLSAWFLIPVYGMTGAAISYAVTIVLINLLRIAELYLYEHIQPFNVSYLKPIIAGGIVYALMHIIVRQIDGEPYIKLIAGSAIFLLLYIGLIWLFKLDKEDKYILSLITDRLSKSD